MFGEDTFAFGEDTNVSGQGTFVWGEDTILFGEGTYVSGEDTHAHLGVGYRRGVASASVIGLALGRSEALKIYTAGGDCDGHLLNNIE